MVILIEDIEKIIKYMEKVFLNGKMEISIVECGLIMLDLVKVLWLGKMNPMMDSGKMISLMVKELILIKMEIGIKVYGKIINKKEKEL